MRMMPHVKALFIELPPFERLRASYLDDESLSLLQAMLMNAPESGDVIEGSGGLRKVRFGDASRGKGKRSGLRIIYNWWQEGAQFWLFTLYGKGEVSDLTPDQRKTLRAMLKAELKERKP